MAELFDIPKIASRVKNEAPLAERMRPQTLQEVLGQEGIIGEGKPLRSQIERDQIPSLILWGPPGSGKTTLARAMAHQTRSVFHSLSAVMAGVKELKEILETAKRQQQFEAKRTVLFVDEIHRWNKSQQDALLPHIEDGTITLVGATTENPSFEVIGPLLSRCKVYVLNRLTADQLMEVVRRAVRDEERGLGKLRLQVEEKALEYIAETADGDARRALNTLEIAAGLAKERRIDLATVEGAIQKKSLLYDKAGEEHYNLISAFIKSMRGSDPDAAVYYLARMLEAGEEPLFLARRMVIFASEDIGNADPQAIQVAIAAMQSFDFVGMPEGWIPLAQSATYLATAPKSRASYNAYQKAKQDVEKEGALPTPLAIRNAPTQLMKELGYGKGSCKKGEFLPEKLRGRKYYEP